MLEMKICTNDEIRDNVESLMEKVTMPISYEWAKIKENVLDIHIVPSVIYYKNQPVGLLNIEELKYKKKYIIPSLKITVGGLGGEGFFIYRGVENADIIDQMLSLIENTTPTKIKDRFSMKEVFVYLDSKHHNEFSKLLNTNGYTENGKLFTTLINLEKGEDELWRKLNKKCRNEIRQGYNRHVKVIQANDLSGIKELYKIKTNYDYWGNNQIHKWENFKKIHQEGISKGLIRIFLAKTEEDIVIAAASILTYRDLVIYYIAGMDREYGWYRPLNVLIWEIIKWSLNRDFKTFDLYGINVDAQNKPEDARSKFKLGFGGDICTIYEMKKVIPLLRTRH